MPPIERGDCGLERHPAYVAPEAGTGSARTLLPKSGCPEWVIPASTTGMIRQLVVQPPSVMGAAMAATTGGPGRPRPPRR
jgi:hypothetical protein